MKYIHNLILMVALLTPTLAHSVNSCRALFGANDFSSTDVHLFGQGHKEEYIAVRQGNIAAHINIDSAGEQPYAFFAFPEGNSGVALWFEKPSSAANLSFTSNPQKIERNDGLHGFSVDMRGHTKSLTIENSILGSMRPIRDRELQAGDWVVGHNMPQPVKVVLGRKILISQQGTSKSSAFVMEIEVLGDTEIIQDARGITLNSPTEIKMRVTGLTSEKPLTPIPLNRIFKEEFLAKADPKELEAISFLFYEEKLMAGSPRYFSLFGRDSMITTMLLFEHMLPEAVEKILVANLSAMNPYTGQASHETHEGDFAAKERRKQHRKYIGVEDAIHDYKMVDDDFLLAMLTLKYLSVFPKEAEKFLSTTDARGLNIKSLVQKNFALVEKKTAAFAANPVFNNLVHLTPGHATGQWRDSENGLGNGIYPFDVNVAFVPAALKGLAELYQSENSAFFNEAKSQQMAKAFDVWNSKALPLFMMTIPAEQVSAYGKSYLESVNLDPNKFPQAPPGQDIVFPAIALYADGSRVPIMHSDDSMLMAFGYPSEEYLKIAQQRLNLPFPYGLKTDVGILVANPVFAPPPLRAKFKFEHYHGPVIWKMVEDVYKYGLTRQLQRPLDPKLKQELRQAKDTIRKVQLVRGMGGVEVLMITFEDGRVVAVPFKGDAKSNPLQLWSYISLGEE